MFAILHALGMFVVDLFKSRFRVEAENLFLRHQLNIVLPIKRLSDQAIKDRDSDQRRSISRSNRQEPRTNNLTIRRLSQLFTLPTATEKKLLSFQHHLSTRRPLAYKPRFQTDCRSLCRSKDCALAPHS